MFPCTKSLGYYEKYLWEEKKNLTMNMHYLMIWNGSQHAILDWINTFFFISNLCKILCTRNVFSFLGYFSKKFKAVDSLKIKSGKWLYIYFFFIIFGINTQYCMSLFYPVRLSGQTLDQHCYTTNNFPHRTNLQQTTLETFWQSHVKSPWMRVW